MFKKKQRLYTRTYVYCKQTNKKRAREREDGERSGTVRLRIEKRLTFCPNGSIINSNKRPSRCLPQPQGVFADLTSNFCEICSMKEESLAGLHCRLGAPSVPDRHALHGLPGQVASHTWVLQLRKTMGFTEENLPEHMATSTVFNVLGSTVTQELPLEGKAVCMFGKNVGGDSMAGRHSIPVHMHYQ